MKLLAVLVVAGWCLSAPDPGWSRSVPKLGRHAYKGEFGWRETDVFAKTYRLPGLIEATDICRRHGWSGYMRWRSFDGARETDPCTALQPVDDAPILPEREKKN